MDELFGRSKKSRGHLSAFALGFAKATLGEQDQDYTANREHERRILAQIAYLSPLCCTVAIANLSEVVESCSKLSDAAQINSPLKLHLVCQASQCGPPPTPLGIERAPKVTFDMIPFKVFVDVVERNKIAM